MSLDDDFEGIRFNFGDFVFLEASKAYKQEECVRTNREIALTFYFSFFVYRLNLKKFSLRFICLELKILLYSNKSIFKLISTSC